LPYAARTFTGAGVGVGAALVFAAAAVGLVTAAGDPAPPRHPLTTAMLIAMAAMRRPLTRHLPRRVSRTRRTNYQTI